MEKIKDGGDSCFRDISRTSVKQSVPDPSITTTDMPAQTEAPKTINVEASKQEMEEIMKIIKKSDYNVVEQLGKTPSNISVITVVVFRGPC